MSSTISTVTPAQSPGGYIFWRGDLVPSYFPRLHVEVDMNIFTVDATTAGLGVALRLCGSSNELTLVLQ